MNGEQRSGDEVANEMLRLLRRIAELEAAEVERRRAGRVLFELLSARSPAGDDAIGASAGIEDRKLRWVGWSRLQRVPCPGMGETLSRRCCN